jgi:hypothetical protein
MTVSIGVHPILLSRRVPCRLYLPLSAFLLDGLGVGMTEGVEDVEGSPPFQLGTVPVAEGMEDYSKRHIGYFVKISQTGIQIVGASAGVS